MQFLYENESHFLYENETVRNPQLHGEVVLEEVVPAAAAEVEAGERSGSELA